MNHQEKQEIFDQYARSNGFENWSQLKKYYNDGDMDFDEHIFAACDLVQEEQQRRIAEKANMIFHEGFFKENRAIHHFQSGIDHVKINKYSILNPKNKIQ